MIGLDEWPAKRFRALAEAFIEGERMRAFHAQTPVCDSLRAAGMQRFRSVDLVLCTCGFGHIPVIETRLRW